jgi:hypothetical protein
MCRTILMCMLSLLPCSAALKVSGLRSTGKHGQARASTAAIRCLDHSRPQVCA